ncbi:hypothetical protein Taro_028074, partial [Colocasia esculenta]|nr:hypothetical protein [Colocasia esculenta]
LLCEKGACITGAVAVVFSILVVSLGSALTTRWAAAWPWEMVSRQAEIGWAKCVGRVSCGFGRGDWEELKMKSKANNTIQRPNKLQQAHLEGPNWMLVVGGALLSTLSIRLGLKLKQIFETKRPDDARNTLKENGKSAVRRRSQPCQLRPKLYSFGQDEDGCYQYNSGFLLLPGFNNS